ncbi:uncharacterized protein OCT59_016987 [Rhizophagus irregularis]|uniref:uncharacterized protein n=1 Tax=Rhizophagus irregularis TaxID=588596 RepID=UPI00333434F7|nr:hypothetical protein OCT59_016987 [Rhizophagus irregularis]
MSNYPGQNVLISYLKERGNKSSYRGFLDNSSDIITTTISSADTVKNLDAIWFRHFLKEAKSLFNQETYVEIRNRVNEEHFRCMKFLQNFWQRIIKEYKKENLASAITLNRTSDIKSSEISQPDIKEYKKENLAPSVTSHLNKISGIKSSEILQSDRIIKEHKKENLAPDVTSHLNKTSDIKSSEISQSDSIKKGELKRVRDDNTDTESLSNEHWKKQSQILKQNKNNSAYIQVVDNALLVASAYESLIADNIIPFIKILKTFLSSRSRMSLSSANEPVLQAIVENLLPLNSEGDNNVILELKYIPLVGLINSNQKNNFGANELENLDKILEKENEESVLKRSYTYWSKEEKKMNLTTIDETLNKGLNQLNLYMKIISKGKAINYSNSGVFDERVKITKSKPNKLKGFVILVIGFRHILWKSANELYI